MLTVITPYLPDAMPLAPPQPPELTHAVVAFCRRARAEGFDVGVSETLDALRAARLGTLTHRRTFKAALQAVLCTTKAESDRFDALFAAFWDGSDAGTARRRHRPQRLAPIRQRQHIPLLMIGTSGDAASDEEGRSTAGANTVERLRRTDFTQVPAQDQQRLEQLVLRLCRQMRLRLSRRRRPTPDRRQIDLRRTLRGSIAQGGEPIALRYRGRRPSKPRLVALLDVSGSMDQYSFFLLRFLYALRHQFARVEAFTFSTRLERITDALHTRRLPDTLSRLAGTADAWSSGTRIGACLQDFNDTYARAVVTPDTLVFVLSDGLDTGEPALLAAQLHAIRRRARKLIWLNPLLGMEGYQPLTRGIQAALPLVDAFVPAHNLDSLLALENHLRHV